MRKLPLLLFAKAPVAGQVKTRLTSHCSYQQAADIAKILIEETLKQCLKAWPGELIMCVQDAHKNQYVQSISNRYQVKLVEQGRGDLGQRMHQAMTAHDYPVAIIGGDVPHVPIRSLQDTYQALQNNHSVIGPCVDGGYYLIGLSQACPSLFDDIPWGLESVYADTLLAAKKAQLELQSLTQSFDVDYWQDLQQASKLVPALADHLKSQVFSPQCEVKPG